METPANADLTQWLAALGTVGSGVSADAERVDQISALEALKGAAAAAQARLTAGLDASQRAEADPRDARQQTQVSRSVAGMVGLARRESPHRGNTFLGLAKALVHEMPCTLAALTAGEISEFKAIVMVKETAVLSAADRREVDRRLADKLAVYGVARLGAAARTIGYELDRTSPLRRVRGAESDRRVSLRPAPDCMAWLGAFLPVTTGVGVFAELKSAAVTARAAGDARTEAQLMADTLAGRVLGTEPAPAQPAGPPDPGAADAAASVGVEVSVVMGEATLFGDSTAPGWVAGYGPVPAEVLRRLVRQADRAWLRRLYVRPQSGELVTMDARRREFSAGLRKLAVLRDDVCATPWCDAPVKHADHVVPFAEGGTSTPDNVQGLCEACNYRKQTPGWTTSRHTERGRPGGVKVTTPTGHSYTSRPPPLPGTQTTRVIHIIGPPVTLEYDPTG